MATICEIYKLGSINYLISQNLQNNLLSARIAGEIPDTILLLEHPSIFTIGASGQDHHIISSSSIDKHKIPIIRTDRGGSITYHGPGQIVVYLIIDLFAKGLSVREFVYNLEEIIVKTLSHFSIKAHGDPAYPGVWVGLEKICSLGIKFVKGCTKHGFALNVNTDLKYFDYILPCGIRDRKTTSISKLLGHKVAIETVESKIIIECARVLKMDIYYITLSQRDAVYV